MESDQDKKEQRIQELELELKLLKASRNQNNSKEESGGKLVFDQSYNKCNLENVEIEKYSRQMILPEIGANGTLYTLKYFFNSDSNLY